MACCWHQWQVTAGVGDAGFEVSEGVGDAGPPTDGFIMYIYACVGGNEAGEWERV